MSPYALLWFAVDTEIYPLKMASEWKCALEKSLIDATKFPLPMEVFKVRCRFVATCLFFLRPCEFWSERFLNVEALPAVAEASFEKLGRSAFETFQVFICVL